MKQIFFKVRLWLGSLQYKQAIRTANRLYKQTGKRYFVLPAKEKGKLMLVNLETWQELQRKREVSQKLDQMWLQRNALYFTEKDSTQMPPEQKIKKEKIWIKHLTKQLKGGKNE